MNIRWPVINSYSSVQSFGIVDFPDMGTSWHSVYERPNIPKVDGWEGQREENIDKPRQVFFFLSGRRRHQQGVYTMRRLVPEGDDPFTQLTLDREVPDTGSIVVGASRHPPK